MCFFSFFVFFFFFFLSSSKQNKQQQKTKTKNEDDNRNNSLGEVPQCLPRARQMMTTIRMTMTTPHATPTSVGTDGDRPPFVFAFWALENTGELENIGNVTNSKMPRLLSSLLPTSSVTSITVRPVTRIL